MDEQQNLEHYLPQGIDIPKSYRRYLTCPVIRHKDNLYTIATPRGGELHFSIDGSALKKAKSGGPAANGESEELKVPAEPVTKKRLEANHPFATQRRMPTDTNYDTRQYMPLELNAYDLEQRIQTLEKAFDERIGALENKVDNLVITLREIQGNIQTEVFENKIRQLEITTRELANKLMEVQAASQSPQTQVAKVTPPATRDNKIAVFWEQARPGLYKTGKVLRKWTQSALQKTQQAAGSAWKHTPVKWRLPVIAISALIVTLLFGKILFFSSTELQDVSPPSKIAKAPHEYRNDYPTNTNTTTSSQPSKSREEIYEKRLERIELSGRVKQLRQALKSHSAEERRTAAMELGDMEQPMAAKHLLKLLKDSDKHVKETAISALIRMKYRPAIPYFIKIAKDPHQPSNIRASVVITLGEMHASEAIASLSQILNHKKADSEVRASAAEALGMIGNIKARQILMAALESREPGVQTAAIDAIGSFAAPYDVPKLASIAKKANASMSARIAAVTALGNMRDSAAIDSAEILVAMYVDKKTPANLRYSLKESLQKLVVAVPENTAQKIRKVLQQ